MANIPITTVWSPQPSINMPKWMADIQAGLVAGSNMPHSLYAPAPAFAFDWGIFANGMWFDFTGIAGNKPVTLLDSVSGTSPLVNNGVNGLLYQANGKPGTGVNMLSVVDGSAYATMPVLNISASFIACIWVKYATANNLNGCYIVTNGNASANQDNFSIADHGDNTMSIYLRCAAGNQYPLYNNGPSLGDNNWHFIVLGYNAFTKQGFYKIDANATVYTAVPGIFAAQNGFVLGDVPNLTQSFTGFVDGLGIAVDTAAYTPAQLETIFAYLYNGGNGKAYGT